MEPMTSQTAPAQEAYAAHSTTISAAALVARIEAQERDIERLTAALGAAARDVTALEEQLTLAQRDNTKLIARIVELEHERDAARRWAAAWRRSARRNRGALDDMLIGYENDKACIATLEHERDEALTTIRIASQRLYDADSGEPKAVARVLLGVKHILRRAVAPAETPPPPMPAEDALSSVASQLAVMIIQERLAAGHTITFASDLTPPTQEGEDNE